MIRLRTLSESIRTARAVLSTIAAAMLTVAGVRFSITIVALMLASQCFAPRLLGRPLGWACG